MDEFSAIIIFSKNDPADMEHSRRQRVKRAAAALSYMDLAIDEDYEFYYAKEWDLIGIRCLSPKVAQIVLAYC